MKKLNLFILGILTMTLLFGCGSSAAILSTPIENIDNTPLKYTELSENESKNWMHLDLMKDTIPGMSVNKAYSEIIKNKKGQTVIVAIIDAGIDTKHEDLDDVIWINKKEIPNNNKDDDKNGYVDDIHGWNFLGDTYDEQFEYVRILVSGDKSHPRYAEAQAEYNKEYQEYSSLKAQYDQIIQQVVASHQAISKHLKKEDYTKEEVLAIKTTDQSLLRDVSVIKQTYGFGIGDIKETIEAFKNDLSQINDRLNVNLNKSLKGRKTGDDPNDFTQTTYGNNNVNPVKKEELHGTHVAGVIAAERNNGKGMNGIANHVKIMALRAVPNGDEYDKDIALAIKYAVDNGAKIINASFGKYYSPHSDKVQEALVYAADNDVLFVGSAGNESLDLDKKPSYPNDQKNDGSEIMDTYLSVGATDSKYGSNLVASYSNYGKKNVDVFAPGSQIYSPKPNNEYDFIDGTSFAAPAVSGVAALIRSYYPKLTAVQVKQIIMDSGLQLPAKVTVPGSQNSVKSFGELSKSSKLVNAYNALIMASKISN
ncbi:S8 family peptidase [Flavobacteriaceae bacterium S0825]|uniref:S8 family peptidase n=1 Tax=Gaetbulibacter sp. S0825 TaxID=2720084 RepID=UPI001431F507|nr:S8 family peptidase [Gaetbulibacter sp. S0825]MCK0108240.1 S8 family peptidase [Flavobacteriaceae bacterium S0825]NIX63876.1 S8 family serine peptidase [Gaetbulibacter sp. S0825]